MGMALAKPHLSLVCDMHLVIVLYSKVMFCPRQPSYCEDITSDVFEGSIHDWMDEERILAEFEAIGAPVTKDTVTDKEM